MTETSLDTIIIITVSAEDNPIIFSIFRLVSMLELALSAFLRQSAPYKDLADASYFTSN
jgi:hypothetical protein